MPKGESVAALYASIGLDISPLQSDLVDVEKTVGENIKRLQSDKNRIKLKADIDLANLGPAASATDQLRVKESALNSQLQAQKQIMALVEAEYQKSLQTKGATAAATQRLETALLREQRSVANLNKSLQENRAAQAKQNAGGATGFFENIGDKVLSLKSLAAGFLPVVGAARAVLEVVKQVGEAIGEMVQGAIRDGEQLYQIAERMHTSGEAADKLKDTLATAGVDYETFTKSFVRLESSVLKGGNETTETLERFGVSLTDASGKLKPMNEQLDASAAGYAKANAEGQGEEFLVQTLGTRGQALAGLLREIGSIREKNAKIVDAGLDVDLIHDVTQETRVMATQWDNVKNSIGNAFMPLVDEIIPTVTEGLALITQAIKDISSESNTMAESFRTVRNNPIFGGLETWTRRTVESIPLIGKKLSSMMEDSGQYVFGDAAKSQLQAEKMARQAKREVEIASAKDSLGGSGTDKKAGEAAKKAAEETAKATTSAQDEIYNATHTTIEKQLNDIDKKAEEFRAKGVEETTITEYTESQKQKIITDFNNTTMARINESYNTALQNRLDGIEREKEAYRQKGVAEVDATKWAETQKLSAVRDAALNIIKQDKARLDSYKEAVRASQSNIGYGVDANGNKVQFEMGNKNALNNWVADQVQSQRDKMGLKPGDSYSAGDIQGFQQALKSINDNLVPGLEANPNIMQKSINAPITVNIDSPVVTDDSMVANLADRVAGVIEPAVQQALGGASNGY